MAACLHASDAKERISACTNVIRDTKNLTVLLRAANARGNALCSIEERCPEAVRDFTTATMIAPKVAGYRDNLSRALRAAGRYAAAEAAADKAIALAPQLAFPYVSKAKALEGAGRIADALNALGRAMTIAPDNASLWEYKGRLLGAAKDDAGAESAFSEALELQPDRASVYVSRAEVEVADGKFDAAQANLTAAMANAPGSPDLEARKTALRARLDQQGKREYKSYDQVASVLDRLKPKKPLARVARLLDKLQPEASSTRAPNVANDHAPNSPVAADKKSETSTYSGSSDQSSCNFFFWTPVQRCIEEYHTDNDPMPNDAPNPRRWNEDLAARGAELVRQHPDVTWDHTKWNSAMIQYEEDHEVEEPGDQSPAEPNAKAKSDTGHDGTGAIGAADNQATAAQAGSPSGQIDACDAPRVIQYLKQSTLTPNLKLTLALQGIPLNNDAEVSGIIQESYDPINEHRRCSAALKVTSPTGNDRSVGVSYTLRYDINRRLDGDRGSWVTCENCQ